MNQSTRTKQEAHTAYSQEGPREWFRSRCAGHILRETYIFKSGNPWIRPKSCMPEYQGIFIDSYLLPDSLGWIPLNAKGSYIMLYSSGRWKDSRYAFPQTQLTLDSNLSVLPVFVKKFQYDAAPVGTVTDSSQVRQGLLWGAWLALLSR